MSPLDIATLQAHLSQLEQENETLRCRLAQQNGSHRQTCDQGCGISSEQRLLEATAIAANALLTIAPFDTAVNTALQILGESLQTDRINVIENFDHPSDPSFPYWRVLNLEWDSPGTMPQFADPEAAQGSYEEVQWLYELLRQNKTASYLIEDAPEPFRSEQMAIGVKSTHAVPIFVEEQWWGILAIDDCREAKQRSASDLAVLKIAADCIGSAIQRERTQQALLQAEQNRAAELAKANEALKRSLDVLAAEIDLNEFIGHVLRIAAEQFDAPLVEYWRVTNPNIAHIVGWWGHNQLHGFGQAHHHPANETGVCVPSHMTEQGQFSDRRKHFVAAFDPSVNPAEGEFLSDPASWYAAFGVSWQLNLPLIVGETCFGVLNFWQPSDRPFTDQQIELGYALTQPVTLAIRLTQLAEEAKQAAIAGEQEKAAQERVAVLERVNIVLQRSTERLSVATDPKAVIVEILRTVAEVLAPLGVNGIGLISYQPMSRTVRVIAHILDGVEKTIAGSDLDGDWSVDSPAMVVPWRRIQSEDFVWGLTTDTDVLIAEVRHYHESLGARAVAYVPLRCGEETTGWIGFDLASEIPPTLQQIEMIRMLMGQVVLAVEMERLAKTAREAAIAREQEKAAQERAAELAKANEALKRSLDALATDPDLDRLIGHVLKIVAEQLDAPVSEYWSTTEDLARLELSCWQGEIILKEQLAHDPRTHGVQIPPELVAYEPLTQRQQHFVVDDLARDPLQLSVFSPLNFDLKAWCELHGVSRHLNMPLQLGNRTIGALTVYIPATRQFTDQQIELAYALAQQVTLAIQLTRLAEEAKQAAIASAIARQQEQAARDAISELTRANDIMRECLDQISQATDLEQLCPSVLGSLIKLLGAAGGSLWRYDPSDGSVSLEQEFANGKFHTRETSGFAHAEKHFFTPDHAPSFQKHQRLIAGETLTLDVRSSDVFLLNEREHLLSQGINTLIVFPMTASGQHLGRLALAFHQVRALLPSECELAKSLANQAALALQMADMAEETKQAAIAREQEQATQQRATELAVINDELKQRDRLLSVVAQITKDLLEVEEIDIAIPAALQAVGEVAEMSRVLLLIESQDPDTRTLHHHIVYEWVAEGVQRSLGLVATNNATFHILIEALHQGQSWWGLVVDLPDVTRLQFEALGILSTGVVPIFFEGRYIGCVAFDDCVNVRQWNQQEIDVLKAAAESIGAALHRKQLVDRLVAERLRAEQERATELAKANEVLRRSLNTLVAEQTLPGYLGHVLTSITHQLNAASSVLWLYDQEQRTANLSLVFNGQTVKPASQTHHPNAHTPRDYSRPERAHAWEAISQQRQSDLLVIAEETRMTPLQQDYLLRQGIWGILSIPLVLGDRTEGTFAIHFHAPRQFREEELELVQTLANQAALAIQMAQLAEQAKEAALLEERNRLAGEIHDTLAQAFTGISMQLSVAKWLIQQDPIAVDQILDRINDIAQSGLAEARRSVWTLYPVEPAYADLAQQLSRCVKQMTSGTDMQVDVQISGSPCPLSPLVGKNLLRIGQEAITNTLKHAHATVLTIHLTYTEQTLCLCIQDNGRGFLTGSDHTGFGLISMFDRADRMNGQLMINSQPAQGTEIRIKVPLSQKL